MKEFGMITDIQRFCVHDGPGIRTTVFLKGCPLNCRWCHNPETKSDRTQIYFQNNSCSLCGACKVVCENNCHEIIDGNHIFNSENCTLCKNCINVCTSDAMGIYGKEIAAQEVIEEVLKDKAFYGKNGGITLSGGEPMFQGDFAINLLSLANEYNISTCIETCGFFDGKYIEKLCNVCDTILWDIKDTNSVRHKENTGVDNNFILSNLSEVAKICANKITLRAIIIKGINDHEFYRQSVQKIAMENGIKNVVFFPFHPYGNGKYTSIGDHKSKLMGKECIPNIE